MVAGQVATILLVQFIFKLDLPLAYLAIPIAVEAASNLLLSRWRQPASSNWRALFGCVFCLDWRTDRDGEKVEDWIAANAKALLGFEVGPKAGRNVKAGRDFGYTVFVLNTWDSPGALTAFPKNEYHIFKVNRTDPDSGDFDGIDWARVWGGRYRFMMVDLGAAPNPYEAETWGNRNRSVYGSANYDPPLWEYRANAPRPVACGRATKPPWGAGLPVTIAGSLCASRAYS